MSKGKYPIQVSKFNGNRTILVHGITYRKKNHSSNLINLHYIKSEVNHCKITWFAVLRIQKKKSFWRKGAVQYRIISPNISREVVYLMFHQIQPITLSSLSNATDNTFRSILHKLLHVVDFKDLNRSQS